MIQDGIIRAKAPLRLGLAGGGTDVSPYSDIYGGAVLNATINLYAHAAIEPRDDGKIIFESFDRQKELEFDSTDYLEIDGDLDLLKGVYNRVARKYATTPLSFKLSTYVDVPPGSGLGSSSTLVVAVFGAFVEWLQIPLGEYEIANEAYEIERVDLKMSGGRQDQYAATFGGFNFMEFYDNEKVIVNPLRIKSEILNELEMNLLLYYSGSSRVSSEIIDSLKKNVADSKAKSLEAMHEVKAQSFAMKEAVLKGQLSNLGDILDYGWKFKKEMTKGITNDKIDNIYETAIKAGATGGRVSGAGGGGFMIFFCPNNMRYPVIREVSKYGDEFRAFQFTKGGLVRWKRNYNE
jgi:D-glycero-alpha-D-manno-heptose-7-phosphate kinase